MARRVLLLASALACFLVPKVSAKLLGGGGPIDRGGNRPWEWCPCSAAPDSASCVQFTAEGSAVLVRFRAVTHATIDSTYCAEPDSACSSYWSTLPPYMKQRIDNVMIVEKSDFFANLEPRTQLCETCAEIFAFDRLADTKFAYREDFDAGVGVGWDLSDGAFFDASVSAPANLGTPSETVCPEPGGQEGPFSGPGGALGFGRADSPPTPPPCCGNAEVRQYASTTALVGGLRAQTPYVLSFWWASHRDENFYGPPLNANELANGDVTVEVYSCDLRLEFHFAPKQLNLSSHGGWVTGYLEPPAGTAIDAIDVSSVTLNGKVPVATSAPAAVGDYDQDGIPDLMLKFPRANVQAGAGDAVQMSICGFVAGECFDGVDWIRVRAAARMAAPVAGSVLVPGSQAVVQWAPGPGRRSAVDLLASFDGGSTWRVEAGGIANTGQYTWTVPAVTTSNARLAVGTVSAVEASGVVFDAEMGESGFFSITSPTDVATRGNSFTIVGVAPNPTRKGFTVSFALPSAAAAALTVYDVKGRLVAVHPVGALGPGLHALTLGEGMPLPAGVYLVRLTQAGKSITARATVIP